MRKGLAIITLSLLIIPSFAFAIAAPNTNVWDPSILRGPLVTCHGAPVNIDSNGNATTNPDSCQNLCDLISTVVNVIYFMIGLVIWILAPIFLTVGGIMFLMAGASPEMVGTARKTLTGTVVGILIVLCSWLIINTFVSVIGITGIGGFGAGTCNVAPPSAPQ